MKHASCRLCTPASPPTPLILSGWAYSNDAEKMRKWEETVAWASANGCPEIVNEIADADFYLVESPSTYTVGLLGGLMYRPWDFKTKTRVPSPEDLEQHLKVLVLRWSEIVGAELGVATRPKTFTGRKARRLLVCADAHVRPPWGGWLQLPKGSPRGGHSDFRAAINNAISPHEIDHVDFTIADKQS